MKARIQPERIREILAAYTGKRLADVTDDARLVELDVDSLEWVELMTAIEEEYPEVDGETFTDWYFSEKQAATQARLMLGVFRQSMSFGTVGELIAGLKGFATL